MFPAVGAGQPAGTVSATLPFDVPPAAAALYVKTIVFDEPLTTFAVGVVIVPEPSLNVYAADGCAAMFVRIPPAVERCCVWKTFAPAVVPAVAPGPPPAVLP